MTKPCPYCGSGEVRTIRERDHYCVTCMSCGAESRARSKAQAEANWNTIRRSYHDEN